MNARLNTYAAIVASPWQGIAVAVHLREQALVNIDFVAEAFAQEPQIDLAVEVARQLHCYFNQANFHFSLPIAPSGTDFQQRVWAAMLAIAPGQTASYADLARDLNTSPRAIGGACRANPIPIVIPCHRVVSKTGLGGFMGEVSGDALRLKKLLLDHEAN